MNSRHFISGWFGLALAVPSLLAVDPSDPVGVFQIRLRGNSDTIVSLPLQRPPLVETTMSSRTGSALVLEADVPAWPAEGAFALVMTGSLEGAVFPITSLSGRALTVDGSGFDLATLKTSSVDGATLADLIAVVPYWTLDALFPDGRGVNASANALLLQSQVMLFDDTQAGKNLSAAAIYYYYSGTALSGPGWYRVGDTQNKAGATRLPPHRYFVVRQNGASESTLQLFGGVQMAGFRLPVATRAANVDQDNLLALPVPVPVSLANSNLVTSGAFQPSTSPLLLTDQLLVFDNTVIAKNKSASAVYYYYQGTALQGTGWYKVGETTRADQVTLAPGAGVIVRKQHTPQPVVKQWLGIPAYLQ